MLDLMYIKHYSFPLDIKLILDTVMVLFRKESSAGVDKTARRGAAEETEGSNDDLQSDKD